MQTYAESIPPGYILAKDAQPGHRYGIPISTEGLGVPLADTEFKVVTMDSEAVPCDCPGKFFSDIIHIRVAGEEELRHLTEGMLLRVE